MRTITILLVDDDARFRQQVKELLGREPDMNVIAEASDGQEAILRANDLNPDVVLMDIRMPGMNAFEAIRRLKRERPRVSVIVVSAFDLEEYQEAAMTSGASGYVVKQFLVQALVSAIRLACSDAGAAATGQRE